MRQSSTFLVPAALAVCDRLRRPLTALGIDHARFRVILEARLVLDQRGSFGGKEGWMGTALLLAMLGAWLGGIPIGLLSIAKGPPELWMAGVAAYTMALVGIVIVTQYAPMIVDATDLAVVSARPVPDRTVFAARVGHVAVYTSALAACCTFWPLALGWLGYRTPWLFVAVPLVVAASAACALGLVALLFAVALRVSGPAGFQRAAFLAQLAGAGIAMGGMQALMPLLTRGEVVDWLRGTSWTRALAPPLQLGSWFAVMQGDFRTYTLVLGCVGVVTPLALAWIAFRLASRHFVAGLAGEIVRAVPRAARWPGGLGAFVARSVTRSALERTGYDFVQTLCRRDKVFLRSGIPMVVGFGAMAFSAVLPFARRDGLPTFVAALPVYLMAITLPGLLETVRFTEHPQAAWVLRAAPVPVWREFVAGGTKALFTTYVVPIFAGVTFVVGCFGRFEVLPHVATAALVTTGCTLIAARLLQHSIPFWREPKMGELDFTNLGVMVGTVLAAPFLAGVHALVQWLAGPWGLAAWAGAGLIACVAGWRGLRALREPTWR